MIKTKTITLSLFERYKNRGWTVVISPIKKQEDKTLSLKNKRKWVVHET